MVKYRDSEGLYVGAKELSYCTLRSQLLMALHDDNSGVARKDPCHELAWTIDAGITNGVCVCVCVCVCVGGGALPYLKFVRSVACCCCVCGSCGLNQHQTFCYHTTFVFEVCGRPCSVAFIMHSAQHLNSDFERSYRWPERQAHCQAGPQERFGTWRRPRGGGPIKKTVTI